MTVSVRVFVHFGFSLPLCGWFGIVGVVCYKKVWGSAGREISEEEGDMRLTPSSIIVGGLVCEIEVVEHGNADCTSASRFLQ